MKEKRYCPMCHEEITYLCWEQTVEGEYYFDSSKYDKTDEHEDICFHCPECSEEVELADIMHGLLKIREEV